MYVCLEVDQASGHERFIAEQKLVAHHLRGSLGRYDTAVTVV